MKNEHKIFSILLTAFLFTNLIAKGFETKLSGNQTFYFEDKMGRNQATFESDAPFESITGMSTEVSGQVSFDVNNFESTLKGEIKISVASLKTGIDLRDEHLRSSDWLEAAKHPEISFKIKKVTEVKSVSKIMLKAKVTGTFTVKGKSKDVIADATITLLEKSATTSKRTEGDLLGVNAKFDISLSDYGIKHPTVGIRVGENTKVSVNIFGSNIKG